MHAQLAQLFQYQALYEGFQHKAFTWYLRWPICHSHIPGSI